MKYTYYIGLIETNTNRIKYVTSVDNKTRCASWDAGQPAQKFTKAAAEGIAFGLVCNGYPAAVLKVPACFELNNGEGGDAK